MPFVDTHCHIHDSEFAGDRDETIARAIAAGVTTMLTLGTDRASSDRAIALAERHPNIVIAAAGVHPHDAAEATDADLDALEEVARSPHVAVVGEIGLDFYRDLSPRDRQIAVLRRQLETAARVSKPVAVHGRDAHDALLPILTDWSREMGGRLPDARPLGVMHYFSEDAAMAERYIDVGFIISVHTSVTHPRAQVLRDVVHKTPLAHLVIETDSPYGAPQAHRGKRNEPAYVVEAAKAIAEIKGIAPADVENMTTTNALTLLGLTAPMRGGAPC
jgi:TatD DNase family protein